VEVLCLALRQYVDQRESTDMGMLMMSGCVDGTIKEWWPSCFE
jgi:hypothetical protein